MIENIKISYLCDTNEHQSYTWHLHGKILEVFDVYQFPSQLETKYSRMGKKMNKAVSVNNGY